MPWYALEVEPGDSLLSAIVAKAYGARACYLIDSGAFAIENITPYRAAGNYVRSLNLSPPDLSEVSNVKGPDEGLLVSALEVLLRPT